MIAYKFTRPDGTDHKTGTVSYRAHLGKELVHPEPCIANGKPCATKDTGGYHLARTLMDAWTYGKPGAIFRCSCRKADVLGEDKSKVRVKALRVLKELPVHEAYGPHGKAVLDFIDSLKDVPWFAHAGEPYTKPSWAKKMETVDSWTAAGAAARTAAGAVAWAAARAAAWTAAGAAARAAAGAAAWAAARAAAWDAAGDAAWDAAGAAAEIMGGIENGYFCHLMEVYRDGHYPASFDGETLVVY
ncbi:MAG: hypothetical protein M0R06_15935 [Sphaerochaeta sp.]|jgi:hypothetical protein|nr:hypothetical protein [Sphaerochaeta sp.]